MLQLIACVALAGLAALVAHPWVKCLMGEADPAEIFGMSGLIGFGLVGTLTYWIGLISIPLALVVVGVALLVAGGWSGFRGGVPKVRFQLAALILLPAVAVSAWHCCALLTSADWDALAYHLAVPKIWWKAGRITEIPFIHHSYFPFALDSVVLFGSPLKWEIFQKSVSWMPTLFGYAAIFGYARRRSSPLIAWWSVAAFAYVPMVIWQAGSAYIDVAHGLHAGFALLYLLEWLVGTSGPPVLMSALLMGLACGTKYTGWQSVVVAMVMLGVAAARFAPRRIQILRAATTIVAVSLLIGGVYLARNVATTGNPVYPFMFERFGGKYWDQWRADLYRNEQQSFGVGRTESGRNWSQFAHATVGLAYQPGRYTNPGQTEGLGYPTNALGPIALLCFLLSPWFRPKVALAPWILGTAGLSLALWFVLSQQSRYCLLLLPLSLPLLISWLSGGRLTRIIAYFAVATSCVYSFGLCSYWVSLIPASSGGGRSPEIANELQHLHSFNAAVGSGRIALFDEVFGYVLNCDYVWANPGHSTLIPSEKMRDGDALVSKFRELGVNYVYVSLKWMRRERAEWFAEASALAPDWYKEAYDDPQTRWQALLADGIVRNRLVVRSAGGRSLLLEIAR